MVRDDPDGGRGTEGGGRVNIPEVYGTCMYCGRTIYSGDDFLDVLENGKIIGLECEECSEKEEGEPNETCD